jgi:hypothetical protein
MSECRYISGSGQLRLPRLTSPGATHNGVGIFAEEHSVATPKRLRTGRPTFGSKERRFGSDQESELERRPP